jgi:hypothetical protein
MTAPAAVGAGTIVPAAVMNEENVEAQTVMKDGRTWSNYGPSKRTVIISAVGLAQTALLAGWIFGAVWWSGKNHADSEEEKHHREWVGKVVFAVCFPCWMLGVGTLAKVSVST